MKNSPLADSGLTQFHFPKIFGFFTIAPLTRKKLNLSVIGEKKEKKQNRPDYKSGRFCVARAL